MDKKGKQPKDDQYPENVSYPGKEDIYNKEKKESLEEEEEKAEKSLDDGLDIPGAELDDEDELIGEEDEENNYYSLGGDNHDDLEEDRD